MKQALIAELRAGPDLLPAEQRVVEDSVAALEEEAEDLLVLAGEDSFWMLPPISVLQFVLLD